MRSESAEAEPAAAAAADHPDPAADPAAAVGDLSPVLSFEMRVTANIRYHEDRQGFLDAAARWANFAVIVAGSGAASTAFAGCPGVTLLTGLITAAVGAAQLVFDFSGKARSHLELRRSFIRLLADSGRLGADIGKLDEEMTLLLSEEPPVFFAVQALAYNAAQLAYVRPEETLLEVTARQQRLRHVWRYEPGLFKTRLERLASAVPQAG